MRTSTNHSGGMNGGITNGMPLIFRVGFRPIPSIAKAQRYLDLNEMKTVMVTGKTRSDVCAAVRGNAVVHAAAALCVYELYLRKYAFGEC